MGGKEPRLRASPGSGWCELAWRKPWCRCYFFFVQKHFILLFGLHSCCSSQGNGRVVTLVHVSSNKMFCSCVSCSVFAVLVFLDSLLCFFRLSDSVGTDTWISLKFLLFTREKRGKNKANGYTQRNVVHIALEEQQGQLHVNLTLSSSAIHMGLVICSSLLLQC